MVAKKLDCRHLRVGSRCYSHLFRIAELTPYYNHLLAETNWPGRNFIQRTARRAWSSLYAEWLPRLQPAVSLGGFSISVDFGNSLPYTVGEINDVTKRSHEVKSCQNCLVSLASSFACTRSQMLHIICPHFHAYYQNHMAVYSIDPVEMLSGTSPRRQQRLVEA